MNNHGTHLRGCRKTTARPTPDLQVEEPDGPFQAPPEVSVKDCLRSYQLGRRGFSGSSRSGLSSSSTLTSLNVSTRTFRTNRAGRYMSQTQASDSFSSK